MKILSLSILWIPYPETNVFFTGWCFAIHLALSIALPLIIALSLFRIALCTQHLELCYALLVLEIWMVQKIIFVMLILGFPAKLPDNGGERAQRRVFSLSSSSPPSHNTRVYARQKSRKVWVESDFCNKIPLKMLTNGWYKWKDSRRGFAASSNYIQGVKLAEKSSAFQRMDLVRGCIFSSLCGSGKTNTTGVWGVEKGLLLFSCLHLLLSETTVLLPFELPETDKNFLKL